MQASTSGQIISSKKKSKKHQKFIKIEKNSNSSEIEIKSVIPVEKNGFSQLINLQDFPELNASGKTNVKIDLGSIRESKSLKSWSSVVSSRNDECIKEAFPVLSRVQNITEKNVNIVKCNLINLTAEPKDSAPTKINFKVSVEKSVDKNVGSKKNEKKQEQTHKNHLKKKHTDPVLINFQDILAINKKFKKSKHHNILRSKVQSHKIKELLSGNILDSSNPKRSRGKQREIKKKKLSKFKTTILKERILKQRMRETAANGCLDSESFNIINQTDFKAEIKAYLNKLSERKLKNSELNKSQKTNVDIIENEKQENLKTQLVCKNEKFISVPKKQIPQIGLNKEIKFSSKFREYCNNIITPELNASVTELIKQVIELQDRLFLRDSIKARAKKRHVSGIREVRKYLNLKKVKMIIIAPNLEKLQMEGSVYDSVNELKSMAEGQNILYGFALDRYKLGKCTKKNVPVSAFAILNYEGLEDLYERTVHHLLDSKRRFSELSSPQKVDESVEKKNEITSKLLNNLILAFQEGLKVSSENNSNLDLKTCL